MKLDKRKKQAIYVFFTFVGRDALKRSTNNELILGDHYFTITQDNNIEVIFLDDDFLGQGFIFYAK